MSSDNKGPIISEGTAVILGVSLVLGILAWHMPGVVTTVAVVLFMLVMS